MVKYYKRVEDDMSFLTGFFFFFFHDLEATKLSKSALAKNVILIWQKQLPIVIMKKIIFRNIQKGRKGKMVLVMTKYNQMVVLLNIRR